MAVYKEEKTGTWRAVYRYTDWNGERKQTQKRGFKTKREAQAWEREDSLGLIYISLQDIGRRKSSGAYYTPEKVVNELIERLYEQDGNLDQKTICDPCCGTGNFLLSLGAKGIDCSNLYGQDIDPISVYLSRINIALIAPQISVADLQSRIIIGNTFFEAFKQKFQFFGGQPRHIGRGTDYAIL